ncbi:glycerol kinase, partial [Tenacibaculum finnmarkense]
VDGGASANNYLMQFQADILNVKVERPEIIETTIMGAAYLAGICVGLWKQEDILRRRKTSETFQPTFSLEKRSKLYSKWQKAVARTKDWID